ncbi:hypothetical protein ACA910_022083 [Epithemia clementina (nom. ined.)]
MAIIQRKRSDYALTLPIITQPVECKQMQPGENKRLDVSPCPSTSTPRRRRSEISVLIGSPDFSLYSSDKVVVEKPSRAGRRPTYTFERTERVQTLLWRAIYTAVVVLWFTGYRNYHSTNSMYQDFVTLLDTNNAQLQESREHLESLQFQLKELQSRNEKMTQMNQAFKHEIRMIDEMAEEDVDMHISGVKMAESSTVSKWIRQREQGLKHRVHLLKKQVQEQSKRTVLEKYGPGPYQVKLTINVLYHSRAHGFDSSSPQHASTFVHNRGMRVKRHFIIELAPLDLMPHSVHLFLDLVESKLWNDSVFLHHDESEHVVAAAPVDYSTHNLKTELLDSLNFKSLSFPEYSPEYPHKKYTVGFAHKGPTIYINTVDNTENHGPGSQEHHLFPEDADPCFGTVIRGQEVIEDLMKLGIQPENRLNPKASHPWQGQNDMFWTRIVAAEIL